MGRIQYAVFDLDGTIIDSEWAHEQAKTSIIAELGGQEDMIDLKYLPAVLTACSGARCWISWARKGMWTGWWSGNSPMSWPP